jgi:hypothetical protein
MINQVAASIHLVYVRHKATSAMQPFIIKDLHVNPLGQGIYLQFPHNEG